MSRTNHHGKRKRIALHHAKYRGTRVRLALLRCRCSWCSPAARLRKRLRAEARADARERRHDAYAYLRENHCGCAVCMEHL